MIFISISIGILFISSGFSCNGNSEGLGPFSVTNCNGCSGKLGTPLDTSFNGSSGGFEPSPGFDFNVNAGKFGSFSDTSFNGSSGGFEPPSAPLFYNYSSSVEIHKNVTTKIIAKYGDSVQFECYASSTAPVKIIWTKGRYTYGDLSNNLLPNGEPRYEGNILQIPSVTQKSQGSYLCNAHTDYDNEYQYYSLEVKAEPLITQTVQKNEFGSRILLSCVAFGNSKSPFKWYRNGQLLPLIEDKKEVNDWSRDSLDDPILGLLEISAKSSEYGGSYKCEIENEFGKDEQVFEIEDSIESVAPQPIE